MSCCLVLLAGVVLNAPSAAVEAPTTLNHLPPTVPPALGCWFWHEEDLKNRQYLSYVDLVAKHSGFNMLTTSLRIPHGELTDDFIHDAIAEGAQYAAKFGIGVAMDLDVRLAREVFQRTYPNELQEMLRIRETARPADGEAVIEVAPEALSDHYTYHAKPYVSMSSRLVRAYAFARKDDAIDPETITEITGSCRVDESTDQKIRVAVPASATQQPIVCACVAFAHFTPDVYAPHLLSYQREILRKYADAHLAGACKDEWGFPPCFDGTPAHNDFWYSEPMAAAYRKRTDRDLVRDCLLMYAGEIGREGDRQGAVNHFMEMNRQRNAEIEGDFYAAVKETFGPNAMVSTHPTWYPYCDRREFKKNGLDWWAARRDYAQTDEVTPFSVRTALAKKWNNSAWYNMFYAPDKREYETGIWSHALAGGRINYHPLYPLKEPPTWNMSRLFEGNIMRGEARIRLLNFIHPAPLDCRIALIFGHACAMNWAGPSYEDVGLSVVNALWQAGYYTDLIPSSEIAPGGLTIRDGKVAYGSQGYDWVILYRPEFERATTAEFFRKAAEGGTTLIRVGDWTRDFDGRPFDGNAALPAKMTSYLDDKACLAALKETLFREAQPETPAIETTCWNTRIVQPPPAGHCRLVDGTRLVLAGESNPAGDSIKTTFQIDGHKVTVDAIGVAAVRLSNDGTLQALAAGGLRLFETANTRIELAEPCDIALWRDDAGKFHGAIQGTDAPIPQPLSSITTDWLRIELPIPLNQ